MGSKVGDEPTFWAWKNGDGAGDEIDKSAIPALSL